MTRHTDPDDLAGLYRKPKAGGCPHPVSRLVAWQGRDDVATGGKLSLPGHVFCVACGACGAVLRGGAELESDSEEGDDHGTV
jgi:hypothetical protein